jgi:tetratricopeptide (TPR) repeat protein
MMRILATLIAFAVLPGAQGEQGRLLYQRGEYAAAAGIYHDLVESHDSPIARYNLGTALLSSEDYESARVHLRIVAESGEGEVQQAARYNLGNSFLFPAFRAEPSAERRTTLLLAVAEYKQALLLDAKDFDAKWNLELAMRLLAQEPTPPSPRAPSGGGGAGEDTESGDIGDPSPQPAEGSGPQPQLSPDEAERLLSSAEDREVGTQQEKLRRPQPPRQSH